MNTPNSTVYISNLSYKRDRNGLRSIFSSFGSIKNIKIVVEPTTGQSRGMAFVEMASINEAKNAIAALDQKIIDGRTVKTKFATPMKVQSRPKNTEVKKQDDLDYVSKQLAKKARNDMKRKSNPFVFKTKSK